MAGQENTLSRAGWIRNQVLKNPGITHSELLEIYDKSGRDMAERPEVTQLLSTGKWIICERYGLKSLDEIPRTSGGIFNMSGMIRCWLNKHPNGDYKAAKEFFAADGLDLNEAIFCYARRHIPGQPRKVGANTKVPSVKVLSPLADQDSPDANQASGSRARFGKKQQRRTHREKVADKFGGLLGVLKTVNEYAKNHGGLDKTEQLVKELQHVADKVGGWAELLYALETLKSLNS